MYVSSADNKVRFERVYGEAVDWFGTRRRHAHTRVFYRRHAVPPNAFVKSYTEMTSLIPHASCFLRAVARSPHVLSILSIANPTATTATNKAKEFRRYQTTRTKQHTFTW